MFISQNAPEIALRYLSSFHFQALRAARQLNEFAERAGMEPFPDGEIEAMERDCAALEAQIGDRLKRDYDWAAPAFGGASPTFDRIEEAVGMDHWRPRYRWASQHNHGGHRPLMKLLGMCESTDPLFLVGPSNSGFVDPLHMSAISLMQLFSTFLLLQSNLDRILMIDIIRTFVDELGSVAFEVEKATFAGARDTKAPTDDSESAAASL